LPGWNSTRPTSGPATTRQLGEWRDGAGLTASLSCTTCPATATRSSTCNVAIWNRVQRADGADAKWRTLDSRSLHNQRLAVAPVADRILETKLSALGYVMVPRPDGNGAEVGGVGQDVKDLFSSRAVAVTGELDRLAREYQAAHGKAPSRRTLWLLHQQAGQNTRAPSPGPPHHRRADRHGRTHRGRSGWPPGKPRLRAAKCTRCRSCTSTSPVCRRARRPCNGSAG